MHNGIDWGIKCNQLANSIVITLFDLQRVQGTNSDGRDFEENALETFLCTEKDKAHQELELFGKRFVHFHLLVIHGL